MFELFKSRRLDCPLLQARFMAEEDAALCDDFEIDAELIEEQEASLMQTCRNQHQSNQASPQKNHSLRRTGKSLRSPGERKEDEKGEAAEDELSPLERLKAATTLPLSHSHGGPDALNDFPLSGVAESSAIVGDLDIARDERLVDVNSGGELFFVFLSASGKFRTWGGSEVQQLTHGHTRRVPRL